MEVKEKPPDSIICIGDFEQRKHRKFKEPIKGSNCYSYSYSTLRINKNERK